MAQAFFHRKVAVFHYFQLPIEIHARMSTRKPLWFFWPLFLLIFVFSMQLIVTKLINVQYKFCL